MRRIRVMPPVYLIAAVVAMTALHAKLPVLRLFPKPWPWLGFVPLFTGIALNLWAASLFKRYQTTLKPGKTSNRLVADGPYRITRNPIYLGMALILAGVAIILGSLSPWLMVAIFIAAIARNVIPVEESMLQESFGTEYEEYRGQVRRWI